MVMQIWLCSNSSPKSRFSSLLHDVIFLDMKMVFFIQSLSSNYIPGLRSRNYWKKSFYLQWGHYLHQGSVVSVSAMNGSTLQSRVQQTPLGLVVYLNRRPSSFDFHLWKDWKFRLCLVQQVLGMGYAWTIIW